MKNIRRNYFLKKAKKLMEYGTIKFHFQKDIKVLVKQVTSKDLLKILHASKDLYVQGYFEYDSKKSGGVTISHLRYGDSKINEK